MSLVAVVGDLATTTSLALAVTWPLDDDVLLVEADRRGGSLAAWLDVADVPSLSAVVARGSGPWVAAALESSRMTPSGVRLLPAPLRSAEAARSVALSDALFEELARAERPVAVVDAGSPVAADGVPAAVRLADVVLVVHRQAPQSPRAAAARLERAAELTALVLAQRGAGSTMLAVVHDAPFDPAEVASFVGGDIGVAHVRLPDDPVAAAVLGGRVGVSPRRFERLPLVRAAADVASTLRAVVSEGHRLTVVAR